MLVRHGESGPFGDDLDHPFVDGHIDPPLYDPDGFEQAERIADRLIATGERIAAIYVTTLQRTQQTAAPLAGRLGLEPRVVADLREVFAGEWEGIVPFKIEDRDPIAAELLTRQRWDVIPGAESAEDFAARVRRGVETIAAAHADELVVAVVHGGVINQIMNLASGQEGFRFMGADNASISHLVIDRDRWIIRCFNDTSHLDPRFSTASEPIT
ncbi:MAG: histidine phosphatase family protein [Ilumatobacteraceae bacterium]